MHEQDAIKSMPLYVDVGHRSRRRVSGTLSQSRRLSPAEIRGTLTCDTRWVHRTLQPRNSDLDKARGTRH